VKDGEQASVEGLDRQGRSLVKSGFKGDVPTLGELLEEAEKAKVDGADAVRVDLDPGDGHPTHVDIDFDKGAIDDEACYEVTRYEAVDRP
jgi:hypothetical protein